MESDVKEQLVARAETTSLEELERRGKRRVKVIRADHIVAMIDQAVAKAYLDYEGGNVMPREEVDQLLARTRAEFEDTLVQRQHQIERLDEELAEAQDRIAQLETATPNVDAPAADLQTPPSDPVAAAPESSAAPAAPDASAAPAAASDTLASALDSLSDAMNDRLDQMSKKLGISTAVEADEVNFEHLFDDHGEDTIESNIDSLQVKKKTGGGIAANLERLKKLKGGD